MKPAKRFKTIEEYIKAQPKEVAEKLKMLDSLVRKIAPQAVPTISYNMPAYKINSSILAYFANHTHHIGLYPYPSALKEFQKEASKYKTAKGSIQFPHDQKLPTALITKILRFRLKEKLAKK